MGSASNSRFAIGRKKQANKDTTNYPVADMVSFPISYNSGFGQSPNADDFSDLIESQFESSNVQILGAGMAGAVEMPAMSDAVALILSGMLGNLVTTLIGVGQVVTVDAGTDVWSIANHGLINGQKVKLSNAGGGLPAGTSASLVYFVGDITSGTFKLYPTLADSITKTNVIDATTTGTGTHTLTPQVFKHTITPLSNADPFFFPGMFFDGTTDRRAVGLVPTTCSLMANFQQSRMMMNIGFAGIRMEDNGIVFAQPATFDETTDTWTVANTFNAGDAVSLSNAGGALPTGYSGSVLYYVANPTSATFQLTTNWFDAAAGINIVNGTTAGTGTHTVTSYQVAYPVQEIINPFHFGNPGAFLSISIDGAAADVLSSNWAGFEYSLGDLINAESRAGANTVRVIERDDRQQSLMLMLDYLTPKYKNIIMSYQRISQPPKMEIQMTMKGKLIGAGHYHSMNAVFPNCQLADHDYNADRSIGKQTLSLRILNDISVGRSVTWEIINDVPAYLT